MDWNGQGDIPKELAEQWCRLAEVEAKEDSWHPSLDTLPGSTYDLLKSQIIAEVTEFLKKDFKKEIQSLVLENKNAVDAVMKVNIPEHAKAEVQASMSCDCGGSKLGLPHSTWCSRASI